MRFPLTIARRLPVSWLFCTSLLCQPGAQQPELVLRTTVQRVEVGIVATSATGATAEGLTAGDFRVWDNGKEQTIASLERLHLPADVAPEHLPPNTHSNRVGKTGQPQVLSMILLDARNTKYVDYQARALPQVKKILGQIPPGELVALYAYGDGAQVKTLHDFSSDKESLLATLGPYHGEWTLHDAWLPPITDPPDARVLAMFNRVRTVDTLGALEALANHVKGVPGRKNLLWVTAGFVVKDSNSEQGVALVRATTAMNDAGVSLYPIDARGLSTSRTAYMVVNTLERMSDATGGVAYHDRNDLDRGVRLALDDARDAYWLTYSPNNLALDGAYHNIRIRTARPGIQIRFRRGYYAPGRKESADLALEDHITRLMSSPLDSSGIGVQATIEPASDHISLAIHIDPVDLNLASVGGKWTGALHLEAVQLGAAGERLGGASQAAELNLAPATYRQALQQGLSFHMKFPRSPAAISVRIGVADDRGDNVGSLSVPLPTPR